MSRGKAQAQISPWGGASAVFSEKILLFLLVIRCRQHEPGRPFRRKGKGENQRPECKPARLMFGTIHHRVTRRPQNSPAEAGQKIICSRYHAWACRGEEKEPRQTGPYTRCLRTKSRRPRSFFHPPCEIKTISDRGYAEEGVCSRNGKNRTVRGKVSG